MYYFTKAAEAEPDDPDLLFNLGYAYALDRDPQGAIYWLREALRRSPADGDAHAVLASALDAAGSAVEAARERELAAQLSPRPVEAADSLRDALATRGSSARARIASRVAARQRRRPGDHEHRAARSARPRAVSPRAGRRLFEGEQDREAMTELRRAVFLSPYEAEAHLLIGRIHLRAGRPREAVDALKISIWSRDTAAAHVALADAYLRLKDVPGRRTHVQKALALDPSSADAKALQERIEKGGQS